MFSLNISSEFFKFLESIVRVEFDPIFRTCQRRCLERHGRVWCHDGHTPSVLGVTCAAIKHARETCEIHAAFPKPVRAGNETDVDYQARVNACVNTRFPGCFYPEFLSFSGGVCTSLHSKTTVGRYLRIVHGKGTGGEDTFQKGLRQMEGYSLCMLLATPVDTFFNGYSPLDVTTIRYVCIFSSLACKYRIIDSSFSFQSFWSSLAGCSVD